MTTWRLEDLEFSRPDERRDPERPSSPDRRDLRWMSQGKLVTLKMGSKRNERRSERQARRKQARIREVLRSARGRAWPVYLTKEQFALVAGDAKWNDVAGGFLFEGDVLVTHCRVGRFSYRARGLAS